MEVEIDLKKSIHKNASLYYDKSKKARQKLLSLESAEKMLKARLEEAKRKGLSMQSEPELEKKRQRQWYEKFHWFFSSDGFLVLAGRDAKSNESLVKKHMEPTDLYFHADSPGSAHCIIQTHSNPVPETTLKEAAAFAAIFSNAWRTSSGAEDVYSVLPEQVSKHAMPGEYLSTGAFMIYGKRTWYRKTALDFLVGVEKGASRIISGPASAIKKNAAAFLKVIPDGMDKGKLAKGIKHLLEKKIAGNLDLDEVVSMLPGGGRIEK